MSVGFSAVDLTQWCCSQLVLVFKGREMRFGMFQDFALCFRIDQKRFGLVSFFYLSEPKNLFVMTE